MSRMQTTNILLVLVLLALVANLVVALGRPPQAHAVVKSEVAKEAVQVSNQVALDKVLGDIGPSLRQMAGSNRDIAEAIRDHARATERIARAIENVDREVPLQ